MGEGEFMKEVSELNFTMGMAQHYSAIYISLRESLTPFRDSVNRSRKVISDSESKTNFQYKVNDTSSPHVTRHMITRSPS